MPSIRYDCTLQRGRVVVQEVIGTLAEATRVRDSELYVRVRNPAAPDHEFEIVVEKRNVYCMARGRLGSFPIHVGTRARLIEEDGEDKA